MGDNDVSRNKRWWYPSSRRKGMVFVAVVAALILAAFGGTYGTFGAGGGAAAATVPSAGRPTGTQQSAPQEPAALGGAHAGPCDIYAGGGTPCVGAYSTTRALYRNYDGPLYQLTRASDGATTEIGVTSPGGFADAAAQNKFCAGT